MFNYISNTKNTMKKVVLFLALGFFATTLSAQVSKTMNNIAGGLYKAVPFTERNTITNLKLTGTIDARDFRTMRDAMPALAVVDLEKVTIVAYSGPGGTEGTIKTKGSYKANTIPQFAFYNEDNFSGKKVVEVIFPKKLAAIGEKAFYYCTELVSLDIPASVTELGANSFYKCTGLTSITVSTPEPIKDMGKGVFYAVDPSTCTLHVPVGAKETYQGAKQWQDFLNILDDVELIQPEKE
jgi:hypothetical protein